MHNVTLPPSIQNLSIEIEIGSWILLLGEDDFAKALFCDLCFGYIRPEEGEVAPAGKGSEVSFLGRSNTTYGQSLVDHLIGGAKNFTKERLEMVAKNSLSERFRRHLNPANHLEFRGAKRAADLEMDERDLLEIAEANLLLQDRKAVVVDTTSAFYQNAVALGFRHSLEFLRSKKTFFWILDDASSLPLDARCWRRVEGKQPTELNFPVEGRVAYTN